jgi:nucleoside-diphosphate-sugar epimerase
MNVFVTGATGYIGRSLVRALLRAGHSVHALARDPAKTPADLRSKVSWVEGNLREPGRWSARARQADALIHCGMEYAPDTPAVDRTALDALLSAAREARAARTVVYTSGIWVIGTTGEKPRDETATTEGAHPLVAWRPAHERLALAANGDVTGVVVRPGIVYGGRGGLLSSFFEDAANGASFVGDGSNRWPGVHVSDLADLYVRLIEIAPTLAGRPSGDRLFHAVDGSNDRVREIASAAARAAGGKEPRSWPVAQASEKLGPLASALTQDQVIVTSRSGPLLGWRPRWRGFVRNADEAFAEWKAGA